MFGEVGWWYPTVGGAVRHDYQAGVFCFHIGQIPDARVFDFGACDVFHMDLHKRDICIVGGYRSSIGQCGCFAIEPWSKAWSSIIVGAY